MFLKILNKDLVHNGFQYREGLNVDSLPFNPTGSCKEGGLYFSDEKHITKFLNCGTKIAIVTLPDDAKVYADPVGDKWKADKIILSDIVLIEESNLWIDPVFCKLAVSQDGLVLRYVQTKTEENAGRIQEICKIAIIHNWYALKYVPTEWKTKEICKLAVTQGGYALDYVPKEMRTEELNSVRLL